MRYDTASCRLVLASMNSCVSQQQQLLDSIQHRIMLETITVTAIIVCLFLAGKTTIDSIRKRWAKVTVVVIGGGPVGFLSTMIAAHSSKVSKVILFEEKLRKDLLNRPQQLAVERRNAMFLKSFGVDFDNIEGCWQQHCFYTRIGVLLEHLLSITGRLPVPVELKLGCKFTKDTLKELENIPGRLLVIACDGVHGPSSSILGVSEEFTQHSCRMYGAVAALTRQEEPQIPTPEVRVHNLTFDLNAYGNDCSDDPNQQGFHLKIFGSYRFRYMSLVVPKCETKLVKSLKVVLDQTVMRNIFQMCFNTYKSDSESKLTDQMALKMKFSPRLFEIKLSQRVESVAFIEDANLFVVTEGDASRCLNFHSGRDINFAIGGLYSLDRFIIMAATATSEKDVMSALSYKQQQTKTLVQDFLRSGLRDTMLL